MNKRVLKRLLCAVLSVLMLVSAIPAMAVFADDKSAYTDLDVGARTTELMKRTNYASLGEQIADMTLVLEHGDYQLYLDELIGTVAYYNKKTDEWLVSNPYDAGLQAKYSNAVGEEIRSQIILSYTGKTSGTMNSFADATARLQVEMVPLKNGIRVEYALGERSARMLLPRVIEATAFEEKILNPVKEALGEKSNAYRKFKSFFNYMDYTGMVEAGKIELANSYAESYPVLKEKNINIYVLDAKISLKDMRKEESYIKAYTQYTLDDLTEDHDYVGYDEKSEATPLFELALEYSLDDHGLVVSMPANGIRFDEANYRVTDIQILPFMGASYRSNEGYTFIPDGSGTLYKLDADDPMRSGTSLYGYDYAMTTSSKSTDEIFRMPVFGQYEEIYTPTKEEVELGDAYVGERKGTTTTRGFLAIIEEGAAMGKIQLKQSNDTSDIYSAVSSSYILRPNEKVNSWTAYAERKYTGRYQVRYVMLTDKAKAEEAQVSKYYECSWMGMACAYRDYLVRTNQNFDRLTTEEVLDANGNLAIPMYIETFGSIETVKKVMSMPVTVSVALTSFEDIAGMYDYLASNGISNINFKMTGYANGGMYAEVADDLEWEDSTGGEDGFITLADYAKSKGFELYPDFDFVYTAGGENDGNTIDMQENVSRSIDKRYTTKRSWSVTRQTNVSYFQMVLSPSTYSDFYLSMAEEYKEYQNSATGISLSTMGSDLNSNFNQDDTILREEAKDYVVEALDYFQKEGYNIMLNGGNAYTWNYADHILNMSLDSSRRIAELRAVPFMGFVLHGYVQYAGSPVNTEGNLEYAMLKAIENGASIYFVLSASNTELLKEDLMLSQNYAVHYTYWQEQMVKLYLELNSALADVQTMLITNHKVLDWAENKTQRVPDADELLEDVAQKLQERADAIEEQLLKDRDNEILAIREYVKNVADAANLITAEKQYMTSNYLKYIQDMVSANSTLGKDLFETWKQAKYLKQVDPDAALPRDIQEKLLKNFTDTVMKNWVKLSLNKENAEKLLISAKEAYDALRVARGDEHRLTRDAKNDLIKALDAYLVLLRDYTGKQTLDFVATGKEAYINGNDASIEAIQAQLNAPVENANTVSDADLEAFIFGRAEANNQMAKDMGAKNLYNAFVKMLELSELDSVINVTELEEQLRAAEFVQEDVVEESEKDEINDKYTVNRDLILVTYGEQGKDYKSFILNYNGYAVQTTYGDKVYTIEAYGYVVIQHAQ